MSLKLRNWKTVAVAALILPLSAERSGRPIQTTSDREFYLDKRATEFIRPGLQIAINSATVSNGTARVTFRIADEAGRPLDRAGVDTPGFVDLNFVLARIRKGEQQYTAYTVRMQPNPDTGQRYLQATRDQGGTYSGSSDGIYTYTFGTAIPSADFDPNVTHSVGIYATRDLSSFGLRAYVANAVHDWVPAGGPVSTVRDIIRTAACNSCHDPMNAHTGGARQEVRLCVMCHTPQTTDHITGQTTDMKVMIHKIHRGADLPSVAASGSYSIEDEDYSTVKFPRDIRACQTCHTGGSQSGNFATQPSRAACGSCHDDVNFATGQGHPGGVQTSDAQCSSCHVPDSGVEFDASIAGAHTVPEQSKQLQGIRYELLSVEGAAGQPVTVVYRVTNRDGSVVDPATLPRFRLSLGGPSEDSTFNVREDARNAPAGRGGYVYRFTVPLPADAKGTYIVGTEGYRDVTFRKDDGDPLTVRETGQHVAMHFAVGEPQVLKRRTVVSVQKCNTCHGTLVAHTGSRTNLDTCTVCHRAGSTDASERPASAGLPETMDFKVMIHKIHTGEHLHNDFTIYDAGEAENFNHIRFSGDRRNCQKCHEGTSYLLPLEVAKLPTITQRSHFTPMQPATAACLSCHDSTGAAAHAYVNAAPFGEACAACHGPEADFAVARMHAR